MKKIGLASILLCVTAVSQAHEIFTHRKIGDAAVAYLQALFAAQAGAQTPQRPLLLATISGPLPVGANSFLQAALWMGAVHEDDGFFVNTISNVPNPYGRFIFHFTPALDDTLYKLLTNIDANGCSSVDWGQSEGAPNGATGCNVSCTSLIPPVSQVCVGISLIPQVNRHRWDQDLTADGTGAPTTAGVNGLGYVIHLLEDLGSPPHTRNDAHPCVIGSFYCDQFEKFNDYGKYAPYGDPFCIPQPLSAVQQTTTSCSSINASTAGPVWQKFIAATISGTGAPTWVISTSGLSSPADFLNALQQYTCKNYYSNRSVFQACSNGTPGPTAAGPTNDPEYIYGACLVSDSGIPVSQIAGTCQNGFRKIAHKSALYNKSCKDGACNPQLADIDQTIAREQFAELGPVIAQHVAAFIQFYAPAVTVTMAGTSGAGTGKVTVAPSAPGNPGSTQITCNSAQSGTAACSGLFVQTSAGAATVQLTAAADPGSIFTGWSGACSGTSASTTIAFTSDQNCTAAFASAPTFVLGVSVSGTGTVTSSPSGINCGSACSAAFPAGTSVTLTATPAAGQSFTGWSGACSGTSASISITLTSEQNCTATFANQAGATYTFQAVPFSNENFSLYGLAVPSPIKGYFTVPQAIPPNVVNFAPSPSTFSFTDGIITITNGSRLHNSSLYVSTDANGNIIAYYFDYYSYDGVEFTAVYRNGFDGWTDTWVTTVECQASFGGPGPPGTWTKQ